MKKSLVSILALIGSVSSLPAGAVVSLHQGAPHTTTMLIGVGRTDIATMLVGAAIVGAALLYRYRRARQ